MVVVVVVVVSSRGNIKGYVGLYGASTSWKPGLSRFSCLGSSIRCAGMVALK